MNFLYDVAISKVRDSRPPIPMSEFFEPVPLDGDRRKSKQVEKMIEKYSLDVYKYNSGKEDKEYLAYQLNLYRIGYFQCYGVEWEFLKGIHLREGKRKLVDIKINEDMAWELVNKFMEGENSE